MVEQVGSGIGRMKDEMKAVKLPAPEFKMDGLFIVVFHRNITEKSSGKSSGKVRGKTGLTLSELF
jgi:predicted HTH transcriptional regulator